MRIGMRIGIEFEDESAPGARRCGGCTLCCKLLPVEEIGKHAGERCRHQRWGKGCAVYRRGLPVSCSLWSCAWLADAGAAGLPRPDRAHYVVDIVADTVRVVPHDGTPPTLLSVIQVWLDPAFPEAHRDPALRAYIVTSSHCPEDEQFGGQSMNPSLEFSRISAPAEGGTTVRETSSVRRRRGLNR